MELQLINNNSTVVRQTQEITYTPFVEISTDKPFIQANTESYSLEEIRDKQIIPVFHKDNEPLISHADFITCASEVLAEYYFGERISRPSIRVSHPIKGRVPEAKHKPANELNEHEKTIYYERMAFIIEMPGICEDIGGNELTLTFGGVKAFNLDNLYTKKGSDEHFKIFIGFQNKVCTNLCVWTDGFMNDLKVNSLGQLKSCIRILIENYNASYHLKSLRKFSEFSITEHQFAQLIGRGRLYQHLPKEMQKEIPELLFGDNQLGMVCKDYFRDESFCRDGNGNISLWKLYNLFTGANKNSYIDSFLDRSVNAFQFVERIMMGLENKSYCWYLN